MNKAQITDKKNGVICLAMFTFGFRVTKRL